MSAEYLEPAVLLAELDARHVNDLDHQEQQVLAAVWLGYNPEEAAPLLHRNPATVRRWVIDLERRILDQTIVPATRSYLRTWTWRHLRCCARATAEMIENAQIS